MRPQWLSVPAAERESRTWENSGPLDRSSVDCPCGCAGEGSVAVDLGRAFRVRVVGVSADASTTVMDPIQRWWALGEARAIATGREGGDRPRRQLVVSRDRLDLAPAARCAASSNRSMGPRMDKHALDVLLSVGRHAVERARLAGADLVIGVDAGSAAAPNLDDGVVARLFVPDDPYRALASGDGPVITVLTGLCIAGAQIGLPVRLHGESAVAAARIALRLHPGVVDWLCRCSPAEGQRVESAPSERLERCLG